MNFKQLTRRVNGEEEAVRFFQEYHVLPSEVICENGHQMKLTFGVKIRWRCGKSACRVDKGNALNEFFVRSFVFVLRRPRIKLVRRVKTVT